MKNSQNKNLNDFNLSSYGYPDKNGHYGIFGGTFVAETLIEPLTDLRKTYHLLKKDPEFLKELYYRHYMRVKKELSTQEKLLFLLFYNNHKLGMITNYLFTRLITISANHKLKFLNNKNEPKQKDF